MLRRGTVKVGDPIDLHEQATLLRLIAQHGRPAFYEGDAAHAIASAAQRAGGWLTEDDLKAYRVRELEPFQCTLGSSRVLTMPLPSSGGIVLAQVFSMLEARPDLLAPALRAGRDSTEYLHLIVECCKHAFADRARWLGDPAFARVPITGLLNPTYLAARAATIDPAKTFPPEHYGSTTEPPSSGGTSHLSAIDSSGGAVSCTETINLYFGSCVAVDKYAFFLNNEMDDFQARTGHANAFGLTHASRNRPSSGKRPLSSMTPTIVLGGPEIDHRPLVLAGASGGPRIISATMQAILNVVHFAMSAQEAVAAPRFHHQWQPDVVQLEAGLDTPAMRTSLQKLGHKVESKDSIGAVQLIRAASLTGPIPIGWQAASDPRKGGVAEGY
jgi:gamma-glutamyltranspeptidase/glutathione hydrolase